MFGTYRVEAGRWRGAAPVRRQSRPLGLSHFLLSVDRMLYVASAALAACVLTILLT